MPFFLAPGQKQVNQLLLGATAVADPEEGPGGPGSPLIFKPNWGPKGGKKIFWDQDPLFQGLDDRPLPPALSESLDPPLDCDIQVEWKTWLGKI